MTGVEGGVGSSQGGGDAIFPLDTRPPMERARTSAFEVYRKPHQGMRVVLGCESGKALK